MAEARCQGRVGTGCCLRPPAAGRPYCWQHDPVGPYQQRRRERRRAEREAREARLAAEWDRQDLLRESGIGDLTDDDLSRLLREIRDAQDA